MNKICKSWAAMDDLRGLCIYLMLCVSAALIIMLIIGAIGWIQFP